MGGCSMIDPGHEFTGRVQLFSAVRATVLSWASFLPLLIYLLFVSRDLTCSLVFSRGCSISWRLRRLRLRATTLFLFSLLMLMEGSGSFVFKTRPRNSSWCTSLLCYLHSSRRAHVACMVRTQIYTSNRLFPFPLPLCYVFDAPEYASCKMYRLLSSEVIGKCGGSVLQSGLI